MSSDLNQTRRLLASFERERVQMRRESTRQLAELDWENVLNFDKSVKELSSLSKKAEKALSNDLGNAFYDIGRGAKSAKEALSDFARNFIRDMSRMTTQTASFQAAKGSLNLIGSIISGSAYAQGGIMPGQFVPMASGGVFSRPTLGLVAEGKNSEAVVPLPNNRSIPVEMQGTQNQPPITVVNVLDQGMIESVVSDTIAKKSQVIVNMIGNDIRQGGVTYQSIKGMR
ncbi:MAG: hypothetical protein HZA78_10575 [Candidatus Schekmanbacteria bacterium]|nr:hypothetical protein [Candidatus Schekmanbacteria bacterium]